MTQITLTIPDELAQQARHLGLLDNDQLTALIEAEIERKRDKAAQELFAILEEIQSIEPRMTQEEIDAEIKAYYAEKSGKKGE
jgi:antitoxin component of MazEF toxin-antitoxin module